MYYDRDDFENFDEGRSRKLSYADCELCGEETIDECQGCYRHVCAGHQISFRKHYDRLEPDQYYTICQCPSCAWDDFMPETEEQALWLRRRINYWLERSIWDRFMIEPFEEAA